MNNKQLWIGFSLSIIMTITACRAIYLPFNSQPKGQPEDGTQSHSTTIAPGLDNPKPSGERIQFNEIGLSMVIPNDWSILDQTGTAISLENEKNASFFYVTSSAESGTEALPILELANNISESELSSSNVQYSEPFEILLSATASLDGVDMKISESNITFRLMTTNTGMRSYLFFFLSEQDSFNRNFDDFFPALQSLEFYTPAPFGLSMEETLFQMGNDPESIELDPAITYTSAEDYVGYLFSGLVRLSPQLQIEPDLAKEWSISSDGLVYTFHLRPDLKFASGNSITAQHIQDSWERAADPKIQSSTAATYLGDILGFGEMLAGEAEHMAGIRVINTQTIEITLDGPKPYFLAKLTYPTAYVYDVSEASDDPENWMWEPDSSGPYTLKEYQTSSHIMFERNPNYHQPAAIPQLLFNLNPGGSPISLYEEGLLDILYVGAETAERIRRPDDALYKDWQSTTTLCTMMIQVNNTIPPMDDPNVRKAFALAIDREIYVDRLTNNLDIPAFSILPPAMPGFTAETRAAGYDPNAAKITLEQSKYAGNLPPITLNAAGFGDSQREDIAALVEMWRSVLNVEIQVEYLDPNQYTQAARQLHGQLVWYGWCADYPDPENFLDVLYHSQSNFNVSGYTNPELDALLEQARVSLEPTERLALYQQAENRILADFGAIPVMHNVYDVLVKPRVRGFILSPMHTAFILGLRLVNP